MSDLDVRQTQPVSVQRWAAVGTGMISRSLVPDLMSCDGAEVVVVHSRDGEKASRFAEEFGIPAATDDFAGMLGDDSIDAVYLATPIATHFEMTRDALRAGKHVLVEKPIATNASEAAELFEIAASERRFLMEAMWMKFNPAFRKLQEEIAEGTIGEPRNLRAGFSIPWPNEGGSRWQSPGGGALLDQGIYPVTLAHSIFGVPQLVVARGTVQPDGVDLAEQVTLEFGDGRFAHFTTGMVEFTDCSAAVAGMTGWITLPSPFWGTTNLEIHAGSIEAIFGNPNRVTIQREGHGYVPMLREVIDAISRGLLEHPRHSAADTLAVFRTIDAISDQLKS